MKKLKNLLLLFLIVISFTACNNAPTIDGSSDKGLAESIQKIGETLTDEQKIEFDAALKTIMFDQVDFGAVYSVDSSRSNVQKTKDEMAADLMKYLDGKTAAQIIQEAEEISKK